MAACSSEARRSARAAAPAAVRWRAAPAPGPRARSQAAAPGRQRSRRSTQNTQKPQKPDSLRVPRVLRCRRSENRLAFISTVSTPKYFNTVGAISMMSAWSPRQRVAGDRRPQNPLAVARPVIARPFLPCWVDDAGRRTPAWTATTAVARQTTTCSSAFCRTALIDVVAPDPVDHPRLRQRISHRQEPADEHILPASSRRARQCHDLRALEVHVDLAGAHRVGLRAPVTFSGRARAEILSFLSPRWPGSP